MGCATGWCGVTAFLQLRSRRFGLPIALLMVAVHAASAASCSDLVNLHIPDVTITSGTSVSAGKFSLLGSSNTLETTAFCRLQAVATHFGLDYQL